MLDFSNAEEGRMDFVALNIVVALCGTATGAALGGKFKVAIVALAAAVMVACIVVYDSKI